jgi:hypothetical protein
MLRPTKDNEKFSFREESEDFGPEMEFQYNNDTAVLAVLLYPQTAKAAATSRCRSAARLTMQNCRPNQRGNEIRYGFFPDNLMVDLSHLSLLVL